MMHLLLVEDNLAEARFLQELLKGASRSFQLVHKQRLGEALAALKSQAFSVALLDLSLPDSQGLNSLDGLMEQAPDLPIVVLTNTQDDRLALEAVQHGAQDYLYKREVQQDILVRSLRYAIERKQAAVSLRIAKEILEQRVRERTIELEKTNQLLQQEVLERQRIQDRLELAQRVGKIGTFEWDLTSDRMDWSKELEALYGFSPGDFPGTVSDWLHRIHPEDLASTQADLQRSLDQTHRFNSEFRIHTLNHQLRWIEAKGDIFTRADGHPQSMIGVHIDITDKKQLEAQFLHAQRLESLGTLASGIAHDLNNILTPILAVVQILPLKLPNLDAQTQQFLQLLDDSARRGADLVKQILAFGRGVEGKQMSLSIKHLLAEVEKMIQQTLPKSIQVCTEVPTHLATVSADATQLHQVFMNLCVNARDAMPQGGTLTLKAEEVWVNEVKNSSVIPAQAGPYVQVTIADTGIGIPPEQLHRIFDPFFTTKPLGQGTGLGLSAVLGIIKRHGGFIEVTSRPGSGSQFMIFLPTGQGPEPEAPSLDPAASGAQSWVLVVDDESAICEITKATLEAHHYQVLTAKSGVEARDVLQHHPVDKVLMDIMMPASDGLITLPLLRQIQPNLHIVAMSGLSSADLNSQVEQLGFDGFLAKPFTISELLQALEPTSICSRSSPTASTP
ncbi:hybrid sensor histidine kinase/response regulator [Lyngbya confervoides]|uniref:histidine kinase n=1 Tax=Lyngbya confervoides BDU141951 TaxID=1574623 RepID=A0ABD4SZQ1_9CYAN|nr:response regulator [Lyngbya confervoides]MCM1981843.1 response regulator [Lyngbya confervoides BDU141951]